MLEERHQLLFDVAVEVVQRPDAHVEVADHEHESIAWHGVARESISAARRSDTGPSRWIEGDHEDTNTKKNTVSL